MQTRDADAVLALLPSWVAVGAWIATPLLMLLAGIASIWLCARCTRIAAEGVHWTELARRRHAARVLLTTQVFVHMSMAAVVTAMSSGALTAGADLPRALLTGLLVWIASRGIVYRHGFRSHLGWTFGEYLRGTALLAAVMLGPAVAIAMAVAGPRIAAASVTMSVSFYAAGALLVAWLMLYGSVPLLRLFGILEPADARLRALVTAAERRTGHTVRNAWLLRSRSANAFAVPWTNAIGVTSHALAGLDDAQIGAVLLHEFGHLREPLRSQALRWFAVVPFLLLALGPPLVHWLGWIAYVGLLLATLPLQTRLRRRTRRLEDAADRHAHEHLHGAEEGTYARALERLHELNLVPAVMTGRALTHPHLYDRMQAAGATPDYPRPLPPPRSRKATLAFALIALALSVGAMSPEIVAGRHRYQSEHAALAYAMLTGGRTNALAAVGYHWLGQRPHDAAVVLRHVADRSAAPEHHAWLAMALVDFDGAAARAALESAEHLATAADTTPWQRDSVAAARARIIDTTLPEPNDDR